MKLSRASGYALQAVVAMAAGQEGAPVASQRTAEAEGIPERLLLRILAPLAKAGVLDSKKGLSGGYFLGKTPARSDQEVSEQERQPMDSVLVIFSY